MSQVGRVRLVLHLFHNKVVSHAAKTVKRRRRNRKPGRCCGV